VSACFNVQNGRLADDSTDTDLGVFGAKFCLLIDLDLDLSFEFSVFNTLTLSKHSVRTLSSQHEKGSWSEIAQLLLLGGFALALHFGVFDLGNFDKQTLA